MDKIQSLFKSRRFWTAAAGVVLVFVHDVLGLTELDHETVQYIVLAMAAWIVGDSIRETE